VRRPTRSSQTFTRTRALIVALAVPALCRAADPATEVGGPIVLSRCTVEFERTTMLGAAQSGLVHEVLVRPGDQVKAGQVLGRLFDVELRAELDLRRAEAASDTDVRLGEARLAQALSKLKASEALGKRNLISAEELNLHKLDAQTAEIEIEAARHRRRIAALASRQVEAMIVSREFVCPHDGIVVSVLKNKGESVAPIEPVFRVVGAATVRVTGFLDVGDAWKIRAGQRVQVRPEVSGAELPIEQQVFDGWVEFVDPEINVENQTCKVVAVASNRGGLLRAGLEARMEIAPDLGPSAANDPFRPSP
jgi:RND family efflux transporter MFP subunit